MTFFIEGLILGIVLLGCGIFVFKVLPKKPELSQKIPRERNIGTAIGGLALVWSAFIVKPLFEGGMAQYQNYLIPIAVAATVASYFYLQYLFTRAFYGLMLLVVTHTMHTAFTENLPQRWIFSIVCMLIGIVAMYFMANPFRFRDLLEKSSKEPQWRNYTAISCFVFGSISIVFAIISKV